MRAVGWTLVQSICPHRVFACRNGMEVLYRYLVGMLGSCWQSPADTRPSKNCGSNGICVVSSVFDRAHYMHALCL